MCQRWLVGAPRDLGGNVPGLTECGAQTLLELGFIALTCLGAAGRLGRGWGALEKVLTWLCAPLFVTLTLW